MVKIIYIFLLTLSHVILIAQSNLKPCGSHHGRSDWLKEYQRNPNAYPRSNDVLYVPLKIHVVGTDNGTGYISATKIFGSLCTLNKDFEPANIQFYIFDEINYINNTQHYGHQTILEGADMMFENNVENVVNVYVVQNAAGNCGYNLPYAGVCLAISCTDVDDHTWAHEMGHNFSLPHPFLGWEGGVTHDGSVDHSFENKAPERVTINYTYFKDTLIRDTLIIDTVFVEKVDRSNCSYAADGFCDTESDYLAIRWQCAGDNFSPNRMKDPNGEEFRSDGTLIMSYAHDNCSYRFSDEQIAAMRANILDDRPYLLSHSFEIDSLLSVDIKLTNPLIGENIYYEKLDLEWDEVENAKYYMVKVSLDTSLNSTIKQTFTNETFTSFELEKFLVGRTLYWGVVPMSNFNTCYSWNDISSKYFNVTNVSSTVDTHTEENFNPTIFGRDRTLFFSFKNIDIELFDINGHKVDDYENASSSVKLSSDLPSGLYFLRSYINNQPIVRKIVIQ